MDERLSINTVREYKFLGLLVLLILFLAFVPVALPEEAAENYSYLIDISSVICLVLSVRIFQVHKNTEFEWIGILAALWLGTALLGELTWTVYEDIRGAEPFPSLADVFWFAAYIPLFFLIFRIVILYRNYLTAQYVKKILVICLPVSIPLVYLSMVISGWDETLLVKMVSLGYVFLDFTALLFLVLILSAYKKAALEVYWWIFTFGILCDVIGDYLFAYYDAHGMYFTGSLPDSFFLLSYLTLILGFGMILKMKTIYLQINPAHENFSDSPQKYQLNVGTSSIVERPEEAYNILKDLTTHGVDGLSISRMHPGKLRKQYSLERIPMLWLTKIDSDTAIDPTYLEKLAYLVYKFVQKSENSVVVLTGVEYLMVHNGFDKVCKLLYVLNRSIKISNSRLVVSVSPRVVNEEQWKDLVREFTLLDEDSARMRI